MEKMNNPELRLTTAIPQTHISHLKFRKLPSCLPGYSYNTAEKQCPF